MKKISPIYPIPHWFQDVLFENKDAAIIMWSFIQHSLNDTDVKEIPVSYADIRNWTGLSGNSSITDNMRLLRTKGYLIRVSKAIRGKIIDGKPDKSKYKINWDCKEVGVEKKVRKLYRHINESYKVATETEDKYTEDSFEGNLSKMVKPGDSIRVGRFALAKPKGVTGSWYNKGYGALRENVAKGPWGGMMNKLKKGNIDDFTARDCLAFWEYQYQEKYNIPYITVLGKDMAVFKNLFNVAHKIQVLRMVRWLFESGQSKFTKPTIGLLGSGYRNEINDLATQWTRARKKKVKINA